MTRLVMLVLAVLAASAAVAQTPGGGRQPGSPGGVLGGLLGADSGTEWTPPAPAGGAEKPSNADTAAPVASELQAAAVRLGDEIARRRAWAPATVPLVSGSADARAIGARYRYAYDVMRDRLYMGAPAPGTAADLAISAFVERWGSLGQRIWEGNRTAALIGVPEWDRVLGVVTAGRCPLGASIPERVATGVLGASAWACVSDAFFADLADHEANANGALAQARTTALARLGAALATLDEFVRASDAAGRAASESPELRRQWSWHLHGVWLAGATARHDELRRLAVRSTSSSFERFLAMAPEIARPRDDGAATLVAAPGQTFRVRLGSATGAVPVVDRRYDESGAGLARALHDVHYRLRTMARRFATIDDDALREYEAELVADLATTTPAGDPRASAAFASRVAQRESELRASRPSREAAARRSLEERRLAVLKAIAKQP